MERGSVFRQAGLSVIFARLGRYEGHPAVRSAKRFLRCKRCNDAQLVAALTKTGSLAFRTRGGGSGGLPSYSLFAGQISRLAERSMFFVAIPNPARDHLIFPF
jgi:hypothetical protein